MMASCLDFTFSKSLAWIDTLNSAAHFLLLFVSLQKHRVQIWIRLSETVWDYSSHVEAVGITGWFVLAVLICASLGTEDCCHSMWPKRTAIKPSCLICQSCSEKLVVLTGVSGYPICGDWRLQLFVIQLHIIIMAALGADLHPCKAMGSGWTIWLWHCNHILTHVGL